MGSAQRGNGGVRMAPATGQPPRPCTAEPECHCLEVSEARALLRCKAAGWPRAAMLQWWATGAASAGCVEP
jgi:hypothetical protein